MLEAIADMSVWKLLIMGILGFFALVITLGITVALAAILGPGMHNAPWNTGGKREPEESSRAPIGHTLGIMAICIGTGLGAAIWWKGDDLSTLVLIVIALVSGGFGLVSGSHSGLGREIKRQQVLDHRHRRHIERERERERRPAHAEAHEPEWEAEAAEAEAHEAEREAHGAEVDAHEVEIETDAPEVDVKDAEDNSKADDKNVDSVDDDEDANRR